jgi:hypothetical protein
MDTGTPASRRWRVAFANPQMPDQEPYPANHCRKRPGIDDIRQEFHARLIAFFQASNRKGLKLPFESFGISSAKLTFDYLFGITIPRIIPILVLPIILEITKFCTHLFFQSYLKNIFYLGNMQSRCFFIFQVIFPEHSFACSLVTNFAIFLDSFDLSFG